MSIKKFKSNGEDIRVTSILGHVAIISKEFRELPEILWSEAYSKGAISSDMTSLPEIQEYIEDKKKEQKQKENEEIEYIKDKLRSIYLNPKDIIDNKGVLVHRKAIYSIGKPVKKDILDSLWSEVIKEFDE